MARQRFLDAADAIKFLSKHGVSVGDRKITLKNGRIGLRSWSAIDYLTGYCGHFISRVSEVH